ncbi:MAG: hypothetical protein P8R42_07110 [Candidatus Binatia bacterium]|nr:hypothetical protein [Candidatus Binatia bacterium]
MNSTTTRFLVAGAALLVVADVAAAGTKVQGNLAPTPEVTGINLPAGAAVVSKSKVQMDDKGKIKATIKLDTKINGDGSFADKIAPTLSGDELIMVVSITFDPGGGAILVETAFPAEVKNGTAKVKEDISGTFGLIPSLPASIQIRGAAVYEIDAGDIPGCEASLAIGFALPGANPCHGANPALAVMGLEIPAP